MGRVSVNTAPPCGRWGTSMVPPCSRAFSRALGGLTGALLGAAATYGFARVQGWTAVVPPWSLAGGLAATLLIGVVAGLYPAVRASRLHPTVALNAT
jgi:ABC-type lipoprotein release transport system permease subunit